MSHHLPEDKPESQPFPFKAAVAVSAVLLVVLAAAGWLTYQGYASAAANRANTDFIAGVHAQRLGLGITDPELIQAGMYACSLADLKPVSTATVVAALAQRSNFPPATSRAVLSSALVHYCPANRPRVKP